MERSAAARRRSTGEEAGLASTAFLSWLGRRCDAKRSGGFRAGTGGDFAGRYRRSADGFPLRGVSRGGREENLRSLPRRLYEGNVNGVHPDVAAVCPELDEFHSLANLSPPSGTRTLCNASNWPTYRGRS